MQQDTIKTGVFNTPSENKTGLFTLISDTTRLGNREHTVKTKDNIFAVALFEQALDIDIEPELAKHKGFYVVEFTATDADCHEAIQLALARGGKA